MNESTHSLPVRPTKAKCRMCDGPLRRRFIINATQPLDGKPAQEWIICESCYLDYHGDENE